MHCHWAQCIVIGMQCIGMVPLAACGSPLAMLTYSQKALQSNYVMQHVTCVAVLTVLCLQLTPWYFLSHSGS